MLEKDFQRNLVAKLKERFPGAMIFKNEGKQGVPDLTVLYGTHWALLECKRSADAPHRPNQDLYISNANEQSFARFIYPENEGEVLDALEQAFRA